MSDAGKKMIAGAEGHLAAIKSGGPIRWRMPVGDGTFLRAVAFVDSGMWVAQGLEFDIGAQGPSMADAHVHLRFTIAAERAARKGTLDGIERAPQRFFDLWEAAA